MVQSFSRRSARHGRYLRTLLEACYVFQIRTVRQSMILLLIILILLIGAVPAWPYSRGWGYYPSGGLGLVLIIILVLYLMGYMH